MRTPLIALLLAGLLVGTAAGDVIHMTDGRKLEGKVLVTEEQRIQLKMRFGTVWLDREKVDRIEAKPLSWTDKKKPIKRHQAIKVDFNTAQRVVFAFCKKYQPALIKGHWNLKVHSVLMQQLAIPKLKFGAFRVVPDLLHQLPPSSYDRLYQQYRKYGQRELAYWYERAWRDAKKARVTKLHRKPSLGALQKEIASWISSHPEFKQPQKFEEVQLLLKRVAYLDDYGRQLGKWTTSELINSQADSDKRYYEGWLFHVFGRGGPQDPLVKQTLESATHPRPWVTDFQVTDEGAKRLTAALAEIKKRLKKETVDKEEFAFDTLGFGTRDFRFLYKIDDRHPHLFRLHRYFHGKKLLAQHLFLRLGKPVAHVLIPDQKSTWYGPVIKR